MRNLSACSHPGVRISGKSPLSAPPNEYPLPFSNEVFRFSMRMRYRLRTGLGADRRFSLLTFRNR